MSLKKDDASTQSSAEVHDRRGSSVSIHVEDEDAHLGVRKVEATHKIYGKYSKWALFTSLGLAAYIYSLDGSTTYSYLAFAASSFGEHSLISSIQVAQSIIIAVGKPVIAKVADVGSRGWAYVIVLVFYVLGYIVIASAQSIQTIAGGIILYAVGYTGLQLLTQIIIADITTLKWRGLVSSLISAPFIVNAFIGSNISSSVLKNIGWRWGYGMFAILVPVSLAPLITTLLWAENKAKKLGIVDASLPPSSPSSSSPITRRAASTSPGPKHSSSLWHRFLRTADQLDVVGLVLLGASVALILIPLTLAGSRGAGYWKNASTIVMLILGIVLLPVFAIWDLRYAKRPVVTMRFIFNRSVVGAALIGFFDFVSFYLTYTYLFSFVLVVKPWSLVNANYFAQTQTLALTIFGIIAGLSMRYLHRYKYVLVVGLIIRLAGVGLMIHSRGANASDAELVWTQILQGMGGGFAAVASQVGAQASVGHVDVAIVTALVLLLTEIGGAVGGAVAGAIWSNMMPGRLAKYLPFLSDEERRVLYGSITAAAAKPRGDPTREGVIQAYDEVMKVMVITATVLSVVPILFALAMPNWYLGDQQNAVDGAGLAGEAIDDDVGADNVPGDADEDAEARGRR